MSTSKKITNVPVLGFWEKADLPFAQLSIVVNTLFAAITGVFRGKGSPKKFSHHLTAAAIRRFCDRLTDRQRQCVLYCYLVHGYKEDLVQDMATANIPVAGQVPQPTRR